MLFSRPWCAIVFTRYIPWLPRRAKRETTCPPRRVQAPRHARPICTPASARTARACEAPGRRGLLAHGEAREAPDDDVLAGLGGELIAQLLHGLAVVSGVVHLLLEQHDRLIPRVQLARDDFLAHVLGLVGGLLLVDARLGVARLGGNVVAADVFDGRRGGDLHGDRAREADEVVIVGDEVGVAVDLDQHADARAGVDVGLDSPLRRSALAEVLDLLALLQAQ